MFIIQSTSCRHRIYMQNVYFCNKAIHSFIDKYNKIIDGNYKCYSTFFCFIWQQQKFLLTIQDTNCVKSQT